MEPHITIPLMLAVLAAVLLMGNAEWLLLRFKRPKDCDTEARKNARIEKELRRNVDKWRDGK